MPYADIERQREYGANYYRRNRERRLRLGSEYGKSEHGRAVVAARRQQPVKRIRHLALQARRRAALSGLPFDAGVFGLADLAPVACACCGKLFDFSVGRGRGDWKDSPSLDRVDNGLGYTVSNTRVICGECNSDKSDLTLPRLRQLLAYMESA